MHTPWLLAVLGSAESIAEARGWGLDTRREVRRALTFLLADHQAGDVIPASTVQTLAVLGMAVERTSEVLAELGLLHDDLTSRLDAWLTGKLRPLGPRIREETSVWVDHLRYGDERTRPRMPTTVTQYVLVTAPLLAAWSTQHRSLREITSDAIHQAIKPLRGSRRITTLVALRSLFALLKKRKLIFTNPTARIHVGRTATVPTPLDQHAIEHAVAAATTPAAKLVLALTAVQALSTAVMRELLLADVDLGQRRLRIRGHERPLDDFTRQAVADYLAYRQRRWPNTANPHLLITQQTAHETGPASPWWFKLVFRGQAGTISRLRQDRILEELQAAGPDPLHLAAVFGVHPTTATRYADALRGRIEEAAEATSDAEPNLSPATPRAGRR